ncbi:MAG: tRNA (N6-isopentenyl adenosine(37)-C2)-methylthiotransferase MiaB [Deltaproteobacteria bacterium]|jgi:tRNA-2-methylthio-N6-dimethylallyladenosine synthase|nr:tRNA (N6-isopentenyl adenosine(37)-C2)-methylthiotransferase MiaB [Deltaproteobacteria bacterium]
MTKRLFITTYGCQMNVYDSERLAEQMRLSGWSLTLKPEEADFIFVNTCSIREKAAQRVIGYLNRLRSYKFKNPSLILGVGGCVAEQEGHELLRRAPWLSLVAGPGRLAEIPSLIETLTAQSPPVVVSGRANNSDNKPLPLFSPRLPLKDDCLEQTKPDRSALTPFLTIMTGCNNYCAYCVVPYLRGPETSRPFFDIIEEAKILLNRGAKEITLLGQNVNSYHYNHNGENLNFVSLLKQIGHLPSLRRLRFTTSHPKDFPSQLVNLFHSLPTLCEHLHLPLQSGSDNILKAMGRGYDRASYTELVDRLRQKQPNLALSTDIIVGFPGETEDDYLQTMETLRQVEFDFIFSFKYSDRPMTKANFMEGKIEEGEKARRLNLLQALQKEITLRKHHGLIGRKIEVLVEGPARNPGQLTSKSRDFKRINFYGPSELIGSIVTLIVTEAWPVSLMGRLS